MDSLNIKQTLFLAFLISVFFKIINDLSEFFKFILAMVSPGGFGILLGEFSYLLGLISVSILILGYFPKLMNIEEESLIKEIRKFGKAMFLFVSLLFFYIFSISFVIIIRTYYLFN